MLKSVIQYINTRLLTTGYFNNLYELVEIKPQKVGSAPMVYCTGGEYKDINTEKNTSYVRLLRSISISESSKVYRSGEVVLNITIPLRVVGLVRNVETDDSYKGANLASDIAKTIAANSMLASVVNARTIDFIPTSLLINTQELYRQEFPGTENTDAPYNYVMAGVDFNVIIEITQECWETACGDTVTDCQVLLASLTTEEKNECILPSYDFSNLSVQSNVTLEQQAQIIFWLGLIPPYPCNVLNNATAGLTMTQRQQIQCVENVQTGQVVSFQTGDDGDLQEGRLVDFYTLKCNNPFGNTNRFTDFFGGTAYANGLMLDWATRLMFRVAISTGTWSAAITAANNATDGGFTDWFIPNRSHLYLVSDADKNSQLNYSPFNFVGTAIWSSTTPRLASTNAFRLINNIGVNSNGNIQQDLKTNINSYTYCRNFIFSDIGL